MGDYTRNQGKEEPGAGLAVPPIQRDGSALPLHRVLLVEDNPGDARLLCELLGEADAAAFAVTTVPRLSDARELARSQAFDVVLLDLSLPDAKGLETFASLSREAPQLPIVVLTGLDDDSMALSAVQQGAQDYLVKGQVTEGILARSLLYAIERQRMRSQLQTLSIRDDLTGLLNRRGFLALAEQHLKTALREGRALAMFFIDLDGMKQINDTYGHLQGDIALRQTADVLRSAFRESDLIARLGGDEFTVLAWTRALEEEALLRDNSAARLEAKSSQERDCEVLGRQRNDASADGAISDGDYTAAMIARLQRHVEEANRHSSLPFHLQLSVGVARFDAGEAGGVEELLERADKALYEQKRMRARLSLSPSPTPGSAPVQAPLPVNES
jgi:two-component system cell cycle response regulator